MRRDRLMRTLVRERFVITLKSGDTFDGLLDDHDDRHLSFVDAHVIGKDGALTAVDGSLFLPRGEIAYMQRPAP